MHAVDADEQYVAAIFSLGLVQGRSLGGREQSN
jgi:hypothetical protein